MFDAPGWKNYSQGVLTPEEIAEVERINREHFAWEKRKDTLHFTLTAKNVLTRKRETRGCFGKGKRLLEGKL